MQRSAILVLGFGLLCAAGHRIDGLARTPGCG